MTSSFVKKKHSRPVHSPLHIPSPQHSLFHARRDLKHKEKSKQRTGTAPLCAEGTQDTDAHTYTWLCTHPYTHASTHAQPQELREEVQRREDRTLMPAWALHQHYLPAPHGAAGHDRVRGRSPLHMGNWKLERQRQAAKAKVPGLSAWYQATGTLGCKRKNEHGDGGDSGQRTAWQSAGPGES